MARLYSFNIMSATLSESPGGLRLVTEEAPEESMLDFSTGLWFQTFLFDALLAGSKTSTAMYTCWGYRPAEAPSGREASMKS